MNKTAKIIIGVLSFILLVVLFLMWDQHRINQINVEKMKVTPTTNTQAASEPEVAPASEVVVLAEDKEPIETAQVSNAEPTQITKDAVEEYIFHIGFTELQSTLDDASPNEYVVRSVNNIKFKRFDKVNNLYIYTWNIRMEEKATGQMVGCNDTEVTFQVDNSHVGTAFKPSCLNPL